MIEESRFGVASWIVYGLECKVVVTLGEFKYDALHGDGGAMLDG